MAERTRAAPWYTQYEAQRGELRNVQRAFRDRLGELGEDGDALMREAHEGLVAKAVHESNWQEGVEVSEPRTVELAEYAFESLPRLNEPSLNLDELLQVQRRAVLTMRQQGVSENDLAAFNLARAHWYMYLVAREAACRRASFVRDLAAKGERGEVELPEGQSVRQEFWSAIRVDCDHRLAEASAWLMPVYDEQGEFEGDPQRVVDAINAQPAGHRAASVTAGHIHLLHRGVLMGIERPSKLGVWRKTHVHIGDHEVLFPPPSAVSSLMSEFLLHFPLTCPLLHAGDCILEAAEYSYRFVAIHPYADGNGRVSRLLMNLILSRDSHPPLPLKADKKGKHRYRQALRRANRGDYKALACLICLSLKSVYDRLLKSVTP